MKRMIAVLFILALLCGLFGGCGANAPSTEPDPTNTLEEPIDTVMDITTTQTEATSEESVPLRVALIADYGIVGADYSGNYAVYEAMRSWSEDNSADFQYYKPRTYDEAGCIAMIEMAIADDYELIMTTSRVYLSAFAKCALKYPEIKFIGMDMLVSELQEAVGSNADFDNVHCCVFRNEIAGYLAGYAAVKLGYTELGFVGIDGNPVSMRYGHGFVQGADAAAGELGVDVTMKYVYNGVTYSSQDLTEQMDGWCAEGIQVIFACEDTWYSAAEAMQKVGGKVIGTVTDMVWIIDSLYGQGITLTSAMVGFYPRTYDLLEELACGNWGSYAGTSEVLGFPYLMLSEMTQWNEGFTQQDYEALCQALDEGTLTVSDDVSQAPAVQYVTVDYLNNSH